MKKIFNGWLLPLCCCALLFIGACSKDDTEPASTDPVPPTLTTQEIPDAGFSFLYSSQTPRTFTMNVDSPWEITKTAGWFVVSPRKGVAGENIEITLTPAYNESDARTGEFTIRANSGNNLHPCLTEKVVKMAQDAYLAAGITVEGTDNDVVSFQSDDKTATTVYVTASYDWTLSLSDKTWVSTTPASGKAGERTAVAITPSVNTGSSKRTSVLTVTATDPSFPENKAEKEISLIQFPPTDKHAVGYTFFSDDFAWITPNWISPYTRYGWPGTNIDGTNSNEFALSIGNMAQVVAAKGYTYSPSVYARYEGCIKLGKTANMGSITTPAISGIDAGKNATLLVQFDAAAYSSAGGTIDDGGDKFYVSVTPPATIGGLTDTEQGVTVKNVWSWTRYSVIVYGATSTTKITFGSERSLKCRLYLDNISVKRAADEGAEAPEATAVTTPLDKEYIDTTPEALFNADGQIIKEGGTLSGSIRVNKAWTAESDCDWLTITAVKCGATGIGVNNGAALANGVATVVATGLPYNNTQFAVSANPGDARTGHILVKVDGTVIETITVSQEKGAAARLTITGLTDNKLELSYDKTAAAASVKFKVTGTHAWTATAGQDESWYSVSPASGTPNTEVEVTVSAAVSNSGIRRFGTLTLNLTPAVGDPVTETIEVSQQTAAPGSSQWDLSSAIRWQLSADDMPKYKTDFAGKVADATAANALPAEFGPAYISYTHTAPSDPDSKCERIVGGTGEPYITGGWPGDSWNFYAPVKTLAAGTKIRFAGKTRTSATGHKYWKLEYKDGGTWKPAATVQTKTVNGAQVEYTHEMAADGKTNIQVDATVTYANAIAGGNVEFRFLCTANWQSDNKSGALAKPNGGTIRWLGGADSPRIEVVQ